MPIRKKLIIAIIIAAVLIAAGVLIWAVTSGKLKPKAESTQYITVSGNISNMPAVRLQVHGQAIFSGGGCSPASGSIWTEVIYPQNNYSIKVQPSFSSCSFEEVKIYAILKDWSMYLGGNFISKRSFQWGQNFNINLTYNFKLHGHVVDFDYNPIAEANVAVKGSAGNLLTTLQTDSYGVFNYNLSMPSVIHGAIETQVSKSGYSFQPQTSSNNPYRFHSADNPVTYNISGIIKGQDSDSTTQVPLELAKVETTINGKKYFARTDKDGKYTLDFSDQTTLPTTPITISASSYDAYDQKDQQITLGQTANQDFTLTRTVQEQWIGGVTDINDYITLDQTTQVTTRQNVLFPEAQAAENWTVIGRVIDVATKNPIPNASVLLKYGLIDSIPDQQTTTNDLGAFSFNTPTKGSNDIFVIFAWKNNEYLIDAGVFMLSDSCKPPVKNTGCLREPIALIKLSAQSQTGGINFLFYGKDVVNYFSSASNQNALANMATVITNLKNKFKVDFPKEVVVSIDREGTHTGASAETYIPGNPLIVYSLRKIQKQGNDWAVRASVHEMGHLIEFQRFKADNKNLVTAKQAHNATCPSYTPGTRSAPTLDINCSFTPVIESTYEGDPDVNGHSWYSVRELFASSFNIKESFLPQFTSWMNNDNYSSDKKNANKFIMNVIETRRQQINGEIPSETLFGMPLNLSKIYSVQYILAGKYP